MAAPLYAATFSAVVVSAAQDVFEIVAPSTKPVWIREIEIGQETEEGDAAAELLPVTLIRGFTTTGSGGASVTPGAMLSGDAASGSTVKRNNTTVAQDGTGVTLRSVAWNVQAPYIYSPEESERIVLAPGERFVVRLPQAPADAMTVYGTLVFEEGRTPL